MRLGFCLVSKINLIGGTPSVKRVFFAVYMRTVNLFTQDIRCGYCSVKLRFVDIFGSFLGNSLRLVFLFRTYNPRKLFSMTNTDQTKII